MSPRSPNEATTTSRPAGAPAPLISPYGWTTVAGPLAGVSLYGLESPRGVILSNMQCDTVWSACVFVGSASPNVSAPSAITNIAQKCSGFTNVWPTYYGVEIAAGTKGAAVSNVNAIPTCGVPSTQLVYYDNVLDGAQMASQNFSAQYCMPARGFKSSRYYTTPFTSVTTTGAVAVKDNILYAIPVPIACKVIISQLSTYVATAGGSGSRCQYGIYADNGSGQPGALILDAGNQATSTSMAASAIGSLSQPLSPGLVFLVAGCATATPEPILRTGSTTGTLLGSLIGFSVQNNTSALVESKPGQWNYLTGGLPTGLPATFPNLAYSATDAAPLVFFTP